MLIKDLQNTFSQPGVVSAISVRPEREIPVKLVSEVMAIEKKGLEGDRSNGGSRQVTLIQKEHMAVIASLAGLADVDFTLTRRNILVGGISLLALKGKIFQIGEATMEYTGECHPCSRMEAAFGTGGYNAMRGHGGITAKVIRGGLIKEGDIVLVLP